MTRNRIHEAVSVTIFCVFPPELKKTLSDPVMPHDGDILYGIIQAERNGDFEEELEYLHQLSSTKRRNTRQLQRQYYSRPIYHALKRLTVFPGLFGKEFRLGCFNRILWMKCPEV